MQAPLINQVIDKSIHDIRSCSWVKDEFREADFGDRRLFLRFLVVAEHLTQLPEALIPQASQGWSKTKAAYRFFDNKSITPEKILDPHISKTVTRAAYQNEPVLVIQDTTFLNYSHMVTSEDLGPIGSAESFCMGLVMHTSLAVSSRGLPLGIVDQVIWARSKEEHGKAKLRKSRRFEDKESFRWIEAQRRYNARMHRLPMVVTICDREADIYDLFYDSTQIDGKFLIRAKHNRSLGNDKLWHFMQQQDVADSYTIEVPEHENSPRRQARVEIRFAPIPLRYPLDRPRARKIPDIQAWAVYVREIDPPPTSKPVEWMLLTNVPVLSTADALEKVSWYKIRWIIEIFHRILKSGCRVEYARLEKNHRRTSYLTIKSIIAWKLLLLTYFHRISPDQPAQALMSKIECSALYVAINNRLPHNIAFNARQAIRWLGELGGFLSRKSDKEPGPTHVWRGWQRLQDFTKMMYVLSPTQHNSF